MKKILILLVTFSMVFGCSRDESEKSKKTIDTKEAKLSTMIQATFFGASNGYRTPVYIIDGEGKLKETSSYKGTFAPMSTAIEIDGPIDDKSRLLLALDYGDTITDGGLCLGTIDDNGFMATDMNCSVGNLIEFYLYNYGVALEPGSKINPGYYEFVTLDSKESLQPLIDVLAAYIVRLNKNNVNRGIPVDSTEVVRATVIDLLFELNDGKSIDEDLIFNSISKNSFVFIDKIDRDILIDPKKLSATVKMFDMGETFGVYIEQLPWVDLYRVYGDQQELGFSKGGFYPVPADTFASINVVGMVGQYFTENSSLVLNNNE